MVYTVFYVTIIVRIFQECNGWIKMYASLKLSVIWPLDFKSPVKILGKVNETVFFYNK